MDWSIRRQLKERVIQSLKVQPNPAQWQILLAQARLKVVGGGERGGKSFTGAVEGYSEHLVTVAEFDRPTLYWLVGEDYEQCRGEFRYLVDFMEAADNVA